MKSIRRKRKQEKARVHDRRATDILAALRGDLAVVEVDDRYEAGAKQTVVVSLRDDPLMRYKVRGFIDQAQYLAGREWQDAYEAVEIGRGRGVDYSQPKVDGGGFSEPLTDRRMRAASELASMGRVLGQFGEAIFRKILGERKFMEQVVQEFGYPATQRQIDGFSLMFRVWLEKLAEHRGLVSQKRSG